MDIRKSFESPNIHTKFIWATMALALVLIVGTVGYHFIGGPEYTWFDAFYMTFITVTTVGYEEVIDMSNNPTARVFTVFICTLGLGTLWFMFSTLTVFILETDINSAWRRRRMEKKIKKLTGHYIVCGYGRVGRNVAHELAQTQRQFVAIDEDLNMLDAQQERNHSLLFLHGDASDDDMLILADIQEAKGVFAVTGDDSKNLMISLTAKQLNPNVRVVARCHEMRNVEKMRKAGADAIVSPDFTGGMRIASAMVRPHVVSFLDEMLRTDHGLRIEEVVVPAEFASRELGSLNLHSQHYVLLAVRNEADWTFNPPMNSMVEAGNTLVAMASPQGRQELEAAFSESKLNRSQA